MVSIALGYKCILSARWVLNFIMKILCCGFFPALQRTLNFAKVELGSVNRARSVMRSVGGKATNSVRVLKTLGAEPLLLGFAGGYTGLAIRDMLDEEAIAHRFIDTEGETRTCQTVLMDNAVDFTELIEDALPLPACDWKSIIKTFIEVESDFDQIIFSGTLLSHAPVEIYAEMIAATDSAKVIIDTVGAPLSAALEQQPALIKINATELRSTVGVDGEIEDLARELIARGAGAVGVTEGADNAMLVTPSETIRFKVPTVEVVSTLGCGDSVNAGTAFLLTQGSSLPEAFMFGLACGSANAQTSMPGMINVSDVTSLVSQIQIF